MTFKLILLLCLASMTMGSWFTNGFQRRRTLNCFIKTDDTKTYSNQIYTYNYDTHAGSCGRAEGRVHSRCTGNFPKLDDNFVGKNICQKVAAKIPANGLKLPIYLTGKAACTKDTSTNAWMDPVQKGSACCVKAFGTIFGKAC